MYVMLAFYLLVRNSAAASNRLGALIFLSFAVWTSAKVIIHNPYTSYELADWIENISILGALSASPFILLLSFALTDRLHLIRNRIFLAAIFLPAIFCIISQIGSDAIYTSVKRPWGWGIEIKLTPATILMVCYSFIYTVTASLLCLHEAFKSRNLIHKKQLTLTAVCFLIGIISSLMSNFFGPAFLSWDSPDMAHISAMVWLVGLLYAITKYNFMEPSPSNAADTLFQAANDGIIIINSLNNTVAVNPACTKLFGYPEEILKSQPITSFFQHPSMIDKILENKEELHDFDNSIRCQDGSLLAVSVSISRIQQHHNEDLGYVLIIRDINERKAIRKTLEDSQTAALIKANKALQKQINERLRTEEALKESEANFRALAEQSLLGMVIIKDFKIVYANKAWQKISGYSFDEMADWNEEEYLKLVHPEDRKKISENTRKKLNGISQESTYDWRLISRNGSTKWISMYSRNINFHGQVAILATLIDTTRQKKMVETIRESEEKYRILVENAHDVIYIIQDGFIKYANQKLFTITGYSLEEIYTKHVFDLVHPEDRELVEQRYQKRIEGMVPENVANYRIIAKNGKTVWIRNMSVLYTWRNRPAILCFAIDTTNEKDMENMLNHIQRRDAIGSMAGGIAHDLNNILAPILGFSELLQDEVPPASEAREAADQIVSASLRAKELIRQILSFSRQKPLKKEEVLLHEVIHEACKLIKSVIPKQITLEKHIEVTDGCIKADPTQIHQVVMNLLTNGYQSITGQGNLQISLSRVTHCKFDADPRKAYLLISVSDTGVGIGQENIQRIFDPYFSTKTEGTGIGLSVVMAIVSDLNGFVEVDSTPDVGTTFNLYFPETLQHKATQKVLFTPHEETDHKKKILLLDDEKPIVSLFSNILKRHGYEVASYCDPQEGIEYFKNHPKEFDLTITDMNMPKLNGLEIVKIIRKENPACPIVICTGYNESLSADESGELGIAEFLQKPVATQDLIRTVNSLLYEQV